MLAASADPKHDVATGLPAVAVAMSVDTSPLEVPAFVNVAAVEPAIAGPITKAAVAGVCTPAGLRAHVNVGGLAQALAASDIPVLVSAPAASLVLAACVPCRAQCSKQQGWWLTLDVVFLDMHD